MKRIVIIGGGIAGLAAAYRFQEALAAAPGSLQCTVLEASERFGGKIWTEGRDGFIIERGPDSFISQKPWAIELCKKIGLEDHLTGTNPKNPQTFVYLNRRMVTMPDGLSLMVPTKFLPFITTPLFSWPGKMRMGLDLILPKRRGRSDESLASFVRRRLGEEALQRMAQPMMAGIFASDPETMSLHATFPMFAQVEKKYRSLILGMIAAKRRQAQAAKAQNGYRPYSLFMTLKNGLSEMVERVIERSPDIEFRTGARVKNLAPDGGAWRITLENGEVLAADDVVLATPANLAEKLVRPFAADLADGLGRIRYVSTAAVTLAYRRQGFGHSLKGFGFVIPNVEGRKITACTWVSSKFPHRAPEDCVLLRAYAGGALNEALAEQDEADLVAMVRAELQDIMGIRAEPMFTGVYRYPKGNVQYGVGHQELVAGLDRMRAAYPGLHLAGSAYTGIGVPDCVQNGTRVAEAVVQPVRENRESKNPGPGPGI